MSARQDPIRPRDAIVDVATRLFSEAGYAGTTMREIATAVGVLPGSLYAHINGKESLLLEIVEGGIDRFLAAVESVEELSDAGDRARMAIRAHLSVVAESPERTLVVFHQWRYLTGANRARIVEKRRRYEAVFTAIFDDGVVDRVFSDLLDAKIAVLAILGSLNWAAEWFKPDGPAGLESVSELLADAMLEGLIRG